MATPAEQMQEKPKRGRPPRKVEQVQADHEIEHFCTIPIGSHMEETLSGERVKRPDHCNNEAVWVPLVTLVGQRREQIKGITPATYEVKNYGFPLRYGPVCQMHRELIEKDPRVLLSGRELESQRTNMLNVGLPKPAPSLTKIKFAHFEPEAEDIESSLLNGLLGQDPELETE